MLGQLSTYRLTCTNTPLSKLFAILQYRTLLLPQLFSRSGAAQFESGAAEDGQSRAVLARAAHARLVHVHVEFEALLHARHDLERDQRAGGLHAHDRVLVADDHLGRSLAYVIVRV